MVSASALEEQLEPAAMRTNRRTGGACDRHCLCCHAPPQHGREEERRQRDEARPGRGRVPHGAP
eukprot:scaffold23566_cov63-Phaeocystis_antarctica.AAC.2